VKGWKRLALGCAVSWMLCGCQSPQIVPIDVNLTCLHEKDIIYVVSLIPAAHTMRELIEQQRFLDRLTDTAALCMTIRGPGDAKLVE